MGKLVVLILCAGVAAQAQQSPHGEISMACGSCHTTASWAMRPDASFRHADVGFALTGKHASLGCRSCHPGLRFSSRPSHCASCHSDIHRGELGQACDRCHSPASWQVPDMLHKHQATRFPLVGRHATLGCESCHNRETARQYAGIPTTCVGCHGNDYQRTQSPNHGAAGFSAACEKCHDPAAFAWSRGFDHSLTLFPLTGAHIRQTCAACHGDNIYTGKSGDCVTCHLPQYQAAQNPDHARGAFPLRCQPCHSTTSWTPSLFNHTSTRFPLTGAHVAVACSECHRNNQFAGLPAACFDCHATEFQNTTNPSHAAANFPHDCVQCHTTIGWSPASFNHNATAFPLTGAHVPVPCQTCHVNGNYQLRFSECYQCHQEDFARAVNPNHTTLQFSHRCEQCHTTSLWTPSTFNHDGQFFRIYSGAHNGRWSQCSECHAVPGNYRSFTCISCHEHNQQTTNNDHRQVQGYTYSSPACYSCHRND